MPRNVTLTDADRDAIRALRRDNPRMPYRVIGAGFGVTAACVCGVLTGVSHSRSPAYLSKPAPEPKPPARGANVQPSDSIIRAIPLNRLMAGNGRCARAIA